MGGNDFKLLNGGRGGLPGQPKANFQITFGESGAAIPCSACKKLENRGFFVIVPNGATLVCIHCILAAIAKYQELHPTEKLLDVDADVDDAAYGEAVKAVLSQRPELTEEQALEVARAVIKCL